MKNKIIFITIIVLLLTFALGISYFISMGLNKISNSGPEPLNKYFKSNNVQIYIINNSNKNKKIGYYIFYPKSSLMITVSGNNLYVESTGPIKDDLSGKIYNIKNEKKLPSNIVTNFLNKNIFINCNFKNNDITSLNEKYDNDFFVEISSSYNNENYSDTIYLMDNNKIKLFEVIKSMVQLSTTNIHRGLNNYTCSSEMFIPSIDQLISKTLN